MYSNKYIVSIVNREYNGVRYNACVGNQPTCQTCHGLITCPEMGAAWTNAWMSKERVACSAACFEWTLLRNLRYIHVTGFTTAGKQYHTKYITIKRNKGR